MTNALIGALEKGQNNQKPSCIGVVRYFGSGNLLSEVAGVVMGRQEGFM
ncbi:hypothetical protein Hanom_Chr02g00122611 [Helianthus anomalus]